MTRLVSEVRRFDRIEDAAAFARARQEAGTWASFPCRSGESWEVEVREEAEAKASRLEAFADRFELRGATSTAAAYRRAAARVRAVVAEEVAR